MSSVAIVLKEETYRGVYLLQYLCTEMQENTWDRLRESSMHQDASHAT